MAHFTDAVQQELAALHAQIDQVWQQIAPLQATIERLHAQHDALVAYLDTAAPDPGPTPPPPPAVRLIENVLRRAGVPLHYVEVAHRLRQEEGYWMPGRDPNTMLWTYLSKWPQFVRVAPGTYTLRDERSTVSTARACRG